MEFDELINEAIQKEIDSATRKLYETMCCNELVKSTSTSSTYTTAKLTTESLNNMIEQLRPEHAILLNNYVPNDIFEIENPLPDKYYCKKLLLVNTQYYNKLFKRILQEYGCNVRVYE